MYHQIRIAADRRREMGVVAKGKSVVADVVCRIDSLCLCANRQYFKHLRLYACAHSLAEFIQVIEFLLVRQVVYTIDEWPAGTHRTRYRAVGEEHKFLDEMMRVIGFLEVDGCGMPVFIEAETHFRLLNIKRPELHSLGTKFDCESIEGC